MFGFARLRNGDNDGGFPLVWKAIVPEVVKIS
jgi:hypothetical protein